MLKCWRILVPAEKLDGFDTVIAQLEDLVWRPEQICLDPMVCSDHSSRAGRIEDAAGSFIFRPP
jgi:hypothetical protein